MDALSRREIFLSALQVEVIGFECVKDMYDEDEDFHEIWDSFSFNRLTGDFISKKVTCLRGNQLSIIFFERDTQWMVWRTP